MARSIGSSKLTSTWRYSSSFSLLLSVQLTSFDWSVTVWLTGFNWSVSMTIAASTSSLLSSSLSPCNCNHKENQLSFPFFFKRLLFLTQTFKQKWDFQSKEFPWEVDCQSVQHSWRWQGSAEKWFQKDRDHWIYWECQRYGRKSWKPFQ